MTSLYSGYVYSPKDWPTNAIRCPISHRPFCLPQGGGTQPKMWNSMLEKNLVWKIEKWCGIVIQWGVSESVVKMAKNRSLEVGILFSMGV